MAAALVCLTHLQAKFVCGAGVALPTIVALAFARHAFAVVVAVLWTGAELARSAGKAGLAVAHTIVAVAAPTTLFPCLVLGAVLRGAVTAVETSRASALASGAGAMTGAWGDAWAFSSRAVGSRIAHAAVALALAAHAVAGAVIRAHRPVARITTPVQRTVAGAVVTDAVA